MTTKHTIATRVPLAGLGVVLAVSACASYVPPAGGPTAELRFAGRVDAVSLYSGVTCASRQRVPKDRWVATLVPADERVSVELWSMQSTDIETSWCSVVVSLVPRAGNKHVILFHRKPESCGISTYAVTPTGDVTSVESVRLEPPRSCGN